MIMAWNPDPKVRDVAEFAKKWGYDRVIVLAVKDWEGAFATISYGKTRAACDAAKKINEQIFKLVSDGNIDIDQ